MSTLRIRDTDMLEKSKRVVNKFSRIKNKSRISTQRKINVKIRRVKRKWNNLFCYITLLNTTSLFFTVLELSNCVGFKWIHEDNVQVTPSEHLQPTDKVFRWGVIGYDRGKATQRSIKKSRTPLPPSSIREL